MTVGWSSTFKTCPFGKLPILHVPPVALHPARVSGREMLLNLPLGSMHFQLAGSALTRSVHWHTCLGLWNASVLTARLKAELHSSSPGKDGKKRMGQADSWFLQFWVCSHGFQHARRIALMHDCSLVLP